jgi:hypothetical protein
MAPAPGATTAAATSAVDKLTADRGYQKEFAAAAGIRKTDALM